VYAEGGRKNAQRDLELPVESVVEQKVASDELAALEQKVELYLRAWRLPETMRAALLEEVMDRVRMGAFVDPEREAIEFSERMIRSRQDELKIEVFAGSEFQSALEPQRPSETHLTTMETSLSRLPSFRMIAGWFLLVTLLVLAFIFTH
jgi:hypothetical protein